MSWVKSGFNGPSLALTFAMLFGSALLATTTWAYIPPNKMIFKRMIDNSGSGSYTIDQEVSIPVGDDNVLIKETWVVEGSQNLRLQATSGSDISHKFHFSAIYKNGERLWIDGGQNKTARMGADFFQGLPFLRSDGEIANLLSNLGLKGNELSRLSRAGGTVSYAIGGISDDIHAESTGIWIEQDQFVIRKVKAPSGAVWKSDSFSNFAKGLMMGNSQNIQWENQMAQIHVRSVKPVKSSAKSFHLEPVDEASAPPQVVEFYNRFR